MSDTAATLLHERKSALEAALGRALAMPDRPGPSDVDPERRDYLLDEAKDLYFNELEWEHLTEEEQLEEGALTELAFPGFLAFVRGLLLEEVMPDSLAEADPQPQVVRLVLEFLAEQAVELEGQLADGADDEEATPLARNMTLHLIDLVLIRLNDLSESEKERVESGLGES